MAKLVIFRKASDKAPKLSVTKIRQVMEDVNQNARVNRDPLISFFLDGSFNRLPVVKQSVIDDPIARQSVIGQGWEIPENCLGRCKGEPTPSTRNSVLLWIKQNLSEYGINGSDVSVILVD